MTPRHRCLATVFVCTAVASGCLGQDSQPTSAPDSRIAAYVAATDGIAKAMAAADWPRVEQLASALMANMRRGDAAWFEAAAYVATAKNQLWDFAGAESIGQDAMAAVIQQTPQPQALTTGYANLPPAARVYFVETVLAVVRAAQARGAHGQAVTLLRFLKRIDPAALGVASRATAFAPSVALANSLIATGQRAEADTLLEAMRRAAPGIIEAANATALLENGPRGLDGYAGRFDGDQSHRARMEALFARIPAARVRLARALGIAESALPQMIVGVADRPQDSPANSAFTTRDPRVPFPPVTIIFSETLALDVLDPEQLLVHELGHAFFLATVGRTYEVMPGWAAEGLSHALAGEFDRIAEGAHIDRCMRDPPAYFDPQSADVFHLDFTGHLSGGAPVNEAGLAVLLLERTPGPGGIKRLLDAVRGGATLDAAINTLTGLTTAQFLVAAQQHVTSLLMAQRKRDYAVLTSIANVEGPAAVAQACENARRYVTSNFVDGFALYWRARSLEPLKQPDVATTVWNELSARRRDHPAYLDDALLGQGRCLIAANRPAEARPVLAMLSRASLSPEMAVAAAALLATLPAPESR